MDRLVPMKFENWSFFDRQRSVFKDMFSKDPFGDMDKHFEEFDKELERMRMSMRTDIGSMDLLGQADRPIVADSEGNKRLSLRFDCKGYKPEEITVKTLDNKLILEARHEEKSEGRSSMKSFSRQYDLPNKIDPLALNSTLSADGILSIEAPAPAAIEAPKERFLSVKHLQIKPPQ